MTDETKQPSHAAHEQAVQPDAQREREQRAKWQAGLAAKERADYVIAGWQVALGWARILAWPVALVLVVWWFHDPLAELIRNITKVNLPGGTEVTVGGHPLGQANPGPVTTAPLAQRSGEPLAMVRPIAFIPLPVTPVKGNIVAGLAVFQNVGGEDARGRIFHVMNIVDTPSFSAQQAKVEEGLFNAFLTQLQVTKSAAFGAEFTIPAHGLAMSWNLGPLLTEDQAEALRRGTKRLYFMGRVRYRSGQEDREVEYCEYRNTTPAFTTTSPCLDHNSR
jgi:hypothetical protein